MSSEKLGPAIFAISAVLLTMATFNMFNKESFSEVAPTQNIIPRYSGGPSLSATQDLENYQDKIVMNVGTSVEDANKAGARYYLNLQNYLNPSIENLELAQNISSRPIMGGASLPGAAESYRNDLGDGYMSNVGHLNGNAFPPVSYKNDRASQLSQCAKDLPMFAASSLLPKPSVNADNNSLSQSAARALSAFTALSPVEQIGAITSNNSPYSKTSDYRALVPIDYNNYVDFVIGGSSDTGNAPFFGQIVSSTGRSGASGFITN
jgi:hypothetical protein